MSMHKLYHGDNLQILKSEIDDQSINLIYIDPPFNTGKSQERITDGKTLKYNDKFTDLHTYLEFLEQRLKQAYRVLDKYGSLFVHLDYRAVHYCRVILDDIFGKRSFMNEIIWAYDFGARSKSKWPTKHDNILWYVKNPDRYTFNYDEMDRIPYMAPGLVGKEKAARGKTPTDVWWHTIVATNGGEKTGYPTQKPIGLLSRIVKVHSQPEDILLDFFAGSGTFGEIAAMYNRSSILVDSNKDAINIMLDRLRIYGIQLVNKELSDANRKE